MTEETIVRLGLEFPDGSVLWAGESGTVLVSVGAAYINVSLADTVEAKAALVDVLCRRAEAAKLAPAAYVGMHRVVSETTTVTVADPVLAFALEYVAPVTSPA